MALAAGTSPSNCPDSSKDRLEVSNVERFWQTPQRLPRCRNPVGFFAGVDLDPPHPVRLHLAELAHGPLNHLIRSAESDFGDQILTNPLGTEPGFQLGHDALEMSLTKTGPSRFGLQRRALISSVA